MEICDICNDAVTPLIVLSCTHLACLACHGDIARSDDKKCSVCFKALINQWPIIHKHELDVMPMINQKLIYRSDKPILRFQKESETCTNFLIADVHYINPPNKTKLLDFIKSRTNKLNKCVMRVLDDIALYNAQMDILAKINRLDLASRLIVRDLTIEEHSELKLIYTGHRLQHNGMEWTITDQTYERKYHKYKIINNIHNSTNYIIKHIHGESLLIHNNRIVFRCLSYISDIIVSRNYINVIATGLIRIDKRTHKVVGRYSINDTVIKEYMKYYSSVDTADYSNLETIAAYEPQDRCLKELTSIFIFPIVIFIVGLIGYLFNLDYKYANDNLSIQNCTIVNSTEGTLSLVYANVSATIAADTANLRANTTISCFVSNCALYWQTDCFMIHSIVLQKYLSDYVIFLNILIAGASFSGLLMLVVIGYTIDNYIDDLRKKEIPITY